MHDKDDPIDTHLDGGLRADLARLATRRLAPGTLGLAAFGGFAALRAPG